MEKKNDEQVIEDEFGTDADTLPKEEAVDSELATEALEEVSEKPAEKAEDTVPLSKYMAQKGQRKELDKQLHAKEIENAELRGKLSTQVAPQVSEKSPIQAIMEEQGVASEEDLELSAGEALVLGRKETAFDAKAAETKAAAVTKESLENEATKLRETAQAVDRGEGLDYDTITKMGESLLTAGEKLDFGNSDNPFELGYTLCIRAILERGDEATKKTLQTSLTRKTEKTVDGDPPPPKEPDPDDETSDDEIVNPRLKALASGIFNSS